MWTRKKDFSHCARLFLPSVLLLLCVVGRSECCDLEEYFNEKQVSVEQSARESDLVFRGLSTITAAANQQQQQQQQQQPPHGRRKVNTNADGIHPTYFELINIYKGADKLKIFRPNRQVNVTILSRASVSSDCKPLEDIPREYIVFCQVLEGHLRALSIAKWDEETDVRVWAALGWTAWTEWSGCSVSCSGGIQQRTRQCLQRSCPGFNIEQRHCNLFDCRNTTNPLAIEEERYYHPSKRHWQRVPDRQNAWRLQPDNYIWLPSSEILAAKSPNASSYLLFPKEFTLFLTLRLINEASTRGTVLSLRSRRRQDTYLSLEVAGTDLKLIHANSNGTDVVWIPANLQDRKWHQISISIRDDSVVESYVDCQWSRTDILKIGSLQIPEDSDLIIGYLFEGDLEQLTIDPDPSIVNLQCYPSITPIIDPNVGLFRKTN